MYHKSPCTFQEVAVPNEDECQWKFWSEETVSDGFELTARLLRNGYSGRYTSYSNDFVSGGSPTVHDEITRYQRLALGVVDMILNPMMKWLQKGMVNSLFLRFSFSGKVPLSARSALLDGKSMR